MDTNDLKMQTLKKYLDDVSRVIYKLCNLKNDDEKRQEWQDRIKKINEDINSAPMLLFVGTFSSGKSTLINALLGEDLLPTASKPCTSVITELSFTRGRGHRGRIIGFNNEVKGEEDYDEIYALINSSGGKARSLAEIHHVELLFDVELLPDWESHQLNGLEKLNVKIVDCPGYESIYPIDENVIDEYIEKASFVYWVNDATNFGGPANVRRLMNINKKSSAIIPIISMSELINEAKREKIEEEFFKCFEPHFNNKELRFVSAFKWIEAQELLKKISPQAYKEMAKEETEKIRAKAEILDQESGMMQIFHDMLRSSGKKEVEDEKFKSTLRDFSVLINEICECAEKEENHWEKNAKSKNWVENDQFKKLEEIKKKVVKWIKIQAGEVNDELKTTMKKRITDYIVEKQGKVDSQEIQEIEVSVKEEIYYRQKTKWEKYIYNEYKAYADEYPITLEDNNSSRLDLGSFSDYFTETLMGMFKALHFAGFQTIVYGGLGGVILAAAASMPASISVGIGVLAVPMSLAGVAAVVTGVGFALVGLAMLPLIPNIIDQVKNRHKNYRQNIENTISEHINKMDFTDDIKFILNGANEKMYESYRENFDNELEPVLDKLKKCRAVREAIIEIQGNVANSFFIYLKPDKI